MAVDFRKHPMFPPGFNAPTRFEADVHDCEVWGEIPADLQGHFYRVQCDFLYRPPNNEWPTGFNGDGHVSLFRFQNGSVDFRSRYVKTDRLKTEMTARKRLWGVYRNHYTDDPSVAAIDRSAANTHIYWHGGHMLVYKEDSLPYEIDPYTLETLRGRFDYEGQYTATTMSAHPKIDPVSGDLICYGYQAKGDLTDDVAVYVFGADGRKKREWWFKVPYVGIMHDIAITQKYILVPLVARTTSDARLKTGEPMWEWNGALETMVAVIPRDGDAKDIRWFRGPARNTLHFLNATDRGNRITMELPVSDGETTPSHIKRWSFDLNSRSDLFAEEVVSLANSPLARMDDRFLSLDYQYCFVGNRNTERPYNTETGGNMAGRVTNEYQRVNVKNGQASTFFVGDTHGLQECMFAPRSRDGAEGDGYLLGIAGNYSDMTSELHIVDAMKMEEGAVAVVKLPFRLRSGTHTNWFPTWELPLRGDRIL
jgi:carotenoid cleavage dioxygenase-like enzyme